MIQKENGRWANPEQSIRSLLHIPAPQWSRQGSFPSLSLYCWIIPPLHCCSDPMTIPSFIQQVCARHCSKKQWWAEAVTVPAWWCLLGGRGLLLPGLDPSKTTGTRVWEWSNPHAGPLLTSANRSSPPCV